MSEKGTVFQKGGGGTNFEQYIQAAFVTTMVVRGNAPCIPQNEIEEIVLQASNRDWATDDILVFAKSKSGTHQLLIQSKHTIVFSEDNEVFKDVILAFWKDFNKPTFNRENDRLLIIKNRLNNIEKNHIKVILNYAKTHSSESDFLSEVNRIKEKKDRLDIFRKVLQLANENNVISDKDLWEFLKCLDILGYDFLNEGSVDETYILNLIKISKSSSIVTEEKEIWNSIIAFVTKNNPAGGSLTKETIKEKEFYSYFDSTRLEPIYKSVEKLLKDSESILKPIKNVIGNPTTQFHISRPSIIQDIISMENETNFIIVTGKPGVGKSAIVKDILTSEFPNSSTFVFRADQFNRPHLANVFSEMGVHQSLPEMFSCLSLMPDKIIFIDSLEKLLEDANPDNAFKQLMALTSEKNIKVIGTSRKYAVELLVQKFGIDPANLKVAEVPQLSDAEVIDVSKHFPVLNSPMKNEKIKTLLRSPKYLDLTIRSLALSADDFSKTSITEFKEKLWSSLVCNASHRANGLPARREKAFMRIAVSRAKEMKLFIKVDDVDDEAVDLLENDDIIFQDGTKRRYAPTHDILEDWALVKHVWSKFDDHNNIKSFFEELGNEPAIRRAFRLWVEDFIIDKPENVNDLIKSSINNDSIERYWADELLTAIFKSDNSKLFFTAFEKELLENNADFLNRCLHLIKTACRETNYTVAENPVLMPIGSGWEEAIIFINTHLAQLNHNRPSILDFLDNWDYRLIFQYPRDKPELFAAKGIIVFYIGQIEGEDEFWMERSLENNQRLIISILFNLPSIAKDTITNLVKRALKEDDERSGWRLHSFYEKVLKRFLSGVGTQRLALVLPDLIIEAAWKHWKYTPPKLNKDDTDIITRVMSEYIDQDYCWGIDEKFGFFPSGIYKTPVYNLLNFHSFEAIKFITEFINYSVDFYVKAKCRYKHEVLGINVTMNDGTIVKQWAGWELWVAYRGLSVTDSLLECLLMTLEKYLLEIASQKTETSRKTLQLAYNYLLRNSNSVMVTGVLVSIAIAYPTEVGEEMLPLIRIKEIYSWESARVLHEGSALAPYDERISFAQKVRWESNRLPHRTKYRRGFADFLVNYQLTIGTLNPQMIKILDEMWEEADSEDIIWRKKLHEIDTRKWKVSQFEEESGQFMIQPNYETPVEEFMNTGKEKMEATEKAAGYSLKLGKVLEGKEQMSFEFWSEYYSYYSTLEKIDVMHDRPVTLAVIGLRDFAQQLSNDQLSWCIQKLSTTIGYIIGETNSRNFLSSGNYNFMEKEVALQSFHLLFNVVTAEEDINELIFMMVYALIAPFAEHEIERLTDYLRLTFAKTHPAVIKKIWTIVIHCSRFKKENRYFYDDPDTNRLQAARKKEFEYVENLCKGGTVPSLDFPAITFTHSQAHLLLVAFCLMPYKEIDKEYEEFLFRFIQLLAEDLGKGEDYSYRRKERQIQHLQILDIEKVLAEILLYADMNLSKKIIDTLTLMTYKIKKADLHRKADFLNFVSKTLDLAIYKLDDFVSNDANKELKKVITDKFWDLWNYLYEIVSKSKKDYFKSALLFDTDISWSEERDHFSVFDGKINDYKKIAYDFEETNAKSVIKILSTIGRKTFLPEGLVWVTDILRKYPEQVKYVNSVACERLIKSLYYNYITDIKNNQTLLTNFIWLLDKMIDLGNSTAYLFRENVITYKKYT